MYLRACPSRSPAICSIVPRGVEAIPGSYSVCTSVASDHTRGWRACVRPARRSGTGNCREAWRGWSGIHGNWPALEAVPRTEPTPDEVVFCGDAADDGPQSVECVRWLVRDLDRDGFRKPVSWRTMQLVGSRRNRRQQRRTTPRDEREGRAMPMHNWAGVKSGVYHNFHFRWIAAIMDRLNAGLLPAGYFAMAEQIIGQPETDVVALETFAPATPRRGGAGGAATVPVR